jgi:hypothetical protein
MARKAQEKTHKDVTGKIRKKSRKARKEIENCKTLLQRPITCLKAHIDTRDKNSSFNARGIEMRDVKLWENFITVKDVQDVWNASPQLNAAMSRALTKKEKRRILQEPPVYGANVNEQAFEVLWRSNCHYTLNLVNLICAQAVQGKDAPIAPMLGDGSCATWIAPNAETGAESKKPDHAGYIFDPDFCHYLEHERKQIFNRIPGDAKLSRKIRREMLPPDGIYYKQRTYLEEAQNVLNQIHYYMDSHEARYGYIVNNEELIFFRRRETGWGHLDISPAIRHDVVPNIETGAINSQYVLWYFHWKVAQDDSPTGWRLRSFGNGTRPKPKTSFVRKSPASKRPQLVKNARPIRGEKSTRALQSILPDILAGVQQKAMALFGCVPS